MNNEYNVNNNYNAVISKVKAALLEFVLLIDEKEKAINIESEITDSVLNNIRILLNSIDNLDKSITEIPNNESIENKNDLATDSLNLEQVDNNNSQPETSNVLEPIEDDFSSEKNDNQSVEPDSLSDENKVLDLANDISQTSENNGDESSEVVPLSEENAANPPGDENVQSISDENNIQLDSNDLEAETEKTPITELDNSPEVILNSSAHNQDDTSSNVIRKTFSKTSNKITKAILVSSAQLTKLSKSRKMQESITAIQEMISQVNTNSEEVSPKSSNDIVSLNSNSQNDDIERQIEDLTVKVRVYREAGEEEKAQEMEKQLNLLRNSQNM